MFIPKDWRNSPDTTTPVSAEALEDLEERLSDYTDSVGTGGVELGYAEITSDFTATTETDVTGLLVNANVGTRPIKVIFDCRAVRNSGAGGPCSVAIKEGSTTLTKGYGGGGTTTAFHPMHREVRLAPSAGVHTYKISLTGFFFVDTGTISADADSPAFIQVIEV